MRYKKVFEYIDSRRDELIALAKDLVAIPSVNDASDYSTDNETNVQLFLEKTLKSYGLETDLWCEDSEQRRPNLVATLRGSGGGKNLILNGHSDVVPVMEPKKWTSPAFSPQVREGKLYGRGAVDMKGGLAAMAFAAKALIECNIALKGNLYLEMVCGEESNQGATIGTAATIRHGYKAPFAVVAEPTSLEIHTTSIGIMLLELIIDGKAVHACCRNQAVYPQRFGMRCGPEVAVDALKKTLPFLDLLYRLEDELNLTWRHEIMGAGGVTAPDQQGVGTFSVNPSIIQGGGYRAAVCSNVKVYCNILWPYSIPMDDVVALIKKKLYALASTDSWFDEHPIEVNLPARQPWLPFYTDMKLPEISQLCSAVESITKKTAVVSGFRAVCDATYFMDNDIPVVICGPGSLSSGAHGDDEFVEIEELIQAAKIYATFAMDQCNQTNE